MPYSVFGSKARQRKTLAGASPSASSSRAHSLASTQSSHDGRPDEGPQGIVRGQRASTALGGARGDVRRSSLLIDPSSLSAAVVPASAKTNEERGKVARSLLQRATAKKGKSSAGGAGGVRPSTVAAGGGSGGIRGRVKAAAAEAAAAGGGAASLPGLLKGAAKAKPGQEKGPVFSRDLRRASFTSAKPPTGKAAGGGGGGFAALAAAGAAGGTQGGMAGLVAAAAAKAGKPVGYNSQLRVHLMAGSIARMSKALMKACRDGRVEHVCTALDSGADPNQLDSHGMSPLMYAAGPGNSAECLKACVGRGGDVNLQSGNGCTALIYAASRNNVESVRWLLQLRVGHAGRSDPPAGARHACDPNLKTANGFTALITAVVHTHLEVARLLLDNPLTHVNDVDAGNWTALHHACKEGHADAVRLLLAAGATLRPRDDRGRTPMEVAQEWEQQDCYVFLYNQADSSVPTFYGVTKPPWTGVADMKWSNAPMPPLADDGTLEKKYFNPAHDKTGDERYVTKVLTAKDRHVLREAKRKKNKKKKRKAKATRTTVRRASLLVAAGVDLSNDPKMAHMQKMLKNVRYTTPEAAQAALNEAAGNGGARAGHKEHSQNEKKHVNNWQLM